MLISETLGLKYPIIQAGMIWVSGAKLAAAAANAGVLGVVGAGSMKPDLLREQLIKVKQLTNNPIAVNIPLLYKLTQEQIQTSLDGGIKIFITSAGSPKLYTKMLKDAGAMVIHVVSTPELAKKCEDAGVDMVIAEGFEAGGHNGRDEITTLSLIPQVLKEVKIPVIAAGGIANGEAMAALLSLGAHGVQMGTRFLMTQESSAHPNFKQAILKAKFNSTQLQMKKIVPVRLLDNNFAKTIRELEQNNASNEELIQALGHGRAKLGMLEGDLNEGELEIGQICSLIKDIPTCAELVKNLIVEYNSAIKKLKPL
jgi:enoyl-[acyl-carrier protein] reductase II